MGWQQDFSNSITSTRLLQKAQDVEELQERNSEYIFVLLYKGDFCSSVGRRLPLQELNINLIVIYYWWPPFCLMHHSCSFSVKSIGHTESIDIVNGNFPDLYGKNKRTLHFSISAIRRNNLRNVTWLNIEFDNNQNYASEDYIQRRS